MATAKIVLTQMEGKFQIFCNALPNNPDPTYIIVNGWECRVTPNKGALCCTSSREYRDGVHEMIYLIYPDGWNKQMLITPKGTKVLRKGYLVPKGTPVKGVIGLGAGYIDGRYVYFRTAEFQRLLDFAHVSAVKKEDPNRAYTGHSVYSGEGKGTFKVITDGKIVRDDFKEEEWVRSAFNTPPGNPNLYDGFTTYEVDGASWVVVETHLDWRDHHNHASILYTKRKDVRNVLKEIADLRTKQ